MHTIRVTRIVPAPRERVWSAWTNSDEFVRWFWPQRLAPACSVDLRTGGSWRIISDALGIAASGEFLEVDPLKRLDYTWRWNDEDEQTRVTLTLDDAAAGGNPATALTVIHTGFRTAEAVEEHHIGWNDCLDRLPEALAS